MSTSQYTFMIQFIVDPFYIQKKQKKKKRHVFSGSELCPNGKNPVRRFAAVLLADGRVICTHGLFGVVKLLFQIAPETSDLDLCLTEA